MSVLFLLSLLFSALFIGIHLSVGRMRFLEVVPRSRLLSAAGGVAVSYVFLHILPELASHQAGFVRSTGEGVRAAELAIYLSALVGLTVFYGLEMAAKKSRSRSRETGGSSAVRDKTFWVHAGSFALYNALISYLLLHREDAGVSSLVFYGIAMSLHFLTTDFGLREDRRDLYDQIGRWAFAAAVSVGLLIGVFLELPETPIEFLFAFLAGGVLLNVLKEELPEERQSRWWPFLFGASAYAALMFAAT